MGLAASQARFLGLTARKSNVEYQGQQINQQRTALSNEILGLYNEYSSLEVPVPPIVNDYQKTVYKVDSTYEDYEIQNFTKILEGEYKDFYDVTLTCDESMPKAYTNSFRDSVVTMEQNASGDVSFLKFQLGTEAFTYNEANPQESNITKISNNYDKYPGLSIIMEAQGLSEGTFYTFTKNGVNYFTSQDDVLSSAFETVEGQNVYYGDYAFDYQGEQQNKKNVVAKAAINQDASGRLTSIQFLESADDPDLVNKVYSVTTTSTDDEQSYADAMNKYNYEKELYEREIEKINHKTETLQKEDRALEMQLRQLDTEQLALKTEMDTVESILKDTMEKVFKTFDG